MRVEYINPFVSSLRHTFQTMLSCEARRGDMVLKEGNLSEHHVSGVIGLSGKAVGTVVVNFSESVALKAASTMLLAEFTEINDEVLDAVGELTNIVAGGAKVELEGYNLMSSLPNVITGSGHEIHFPSDVTPVSISFDTDWGPLSLEVGFTEVPVPAGG